MNLREACIDLDGHVFANGRVTYPNDDAGHFPLAQHEGVRLRLFGNSLSITPATARRDAASCFLVTEEMGPVISVPGAIGLTIRHELRFNRGTELQLTLTGPQGTVSSSADRDNAKEQPTSDWALSISAGSDVLKIVLSAALAAKEPIWPVFKNRDNFWTSASTEPARIDIEFTVDASTRMAAFRMMDTEPDNSMPGELAQAHNRSLSDLDLGEAPIDRMGGEFAYMQGGRWVDFHSSTKAIYITPQGRKTRLSNGLLAYNPSNDIWPRICLHGIDMNDVIGLLRRTLTATVELSDGLYGSLQQHHLFHESHTPVPHQIIRGAKLHFQLTLEGLSITYRFLVDDLHTSSSAPHLPGWLENQLTLPWELLILRYPEFLRHRANLLSDDQPDRGGVRRDALSNS